MIPQLVLGACVTAVAVIRRRRFRRLTRRSTSAQTNTEENLTPLEVSHQRDLQQLFEIASSHPRLLFSNRLRSRIQRLSRRINQSNDPVPWQLAFIYRQMEITVDTLSYDELYELFGGNPTPPAITREEVKYLKNNVFLSTEACPREDNEDVRSDEITCPICLEAYEQGDKILVLPSCKHCFHSRCVVRWLRHRGDCPICRRTIKDEIKAAKCLKLPHCTN